MPSPTWRWFRSCALRGTASTEAASHNMPSGVSHGSGEPPSIFQRTLHYHSGQKHSNAESYHARRQTLARGFLWRCSKNRRRNSELDSRINLEHKVLLFFEVCDGMENIAHGQHSAAVRPPVLHVRRAFLGVVEQHASWKQIKDQSNPPRHHTEMLLYSGRICYRFL